MKPVIAIRPEPGLAATIAAGAAEGIEIGGYPLSRVEPVEWQAPAPELFDGLLVGSANVFRHGGSALADLRNLPVLAVGETTAAAAEKAGFSVETTGSGGLQLLLDGLEPQPRRLLRLAGETRVSLHPPEQVRLFERVVYRTVDLPMPDEMIRLLSANPLILLHSAGAAKHFASECDRCGIARGGIALAALGPRILAAAGPGWQDARAAERPGEAQLLALARHMCH